MRERENAPSRSRLFQVTKENTVSRHVLSAGAGCLFLAALFSTVPAQEPAKQFKSKSRPESGSSEELKDRFSTTRHSIALGAAKLEYEATAGQLVLKGEDGKPRAGIFFTAYTKADVKDQTTRPITFLFNGGPGSSSVWLHMGAFGPRRIVFSEDGKKVAPPYRLVDNEATLLDATDLVFIDPVSHRLQPAGFGPGRQAISRRPGRHQRQCRLHPALRQSIQPLGLAEIPGRRELRHHPRGRDGRSLARPGRHELQRRHPHLGRPELSNAPLRRRQRPAVHPLPTGLHGHGLVSQEAVRRTAGRSFQDAWPPPRGLP